MCISFGNICYLATTKSGTVPIHTALGQLLSVPFVFGMFHQESPCQRANYMVIPDQFRFRCYYVHTFEWLL